MTMTSGDAIVLASQPGEPTIRRSLTPVCMLIFDRLTKCFGALTPLDGISLAIKPGECFGLLGPKSPSLPANPAARSALVPQSRAL
jgi:hypothetical protein